MLGDHIACLHVNMNRLAFDEQRDRGNAKHFRGAAYITIKANAPWESEWWEDCESAMHGTIRVIKVENRTVWRNIKK